MPNEAEWWLCEGGGLICSNCGCFFDEDFGELRPTRCKRCCFNMVGINMEYEIDTSNRLVIGVNYAEEDEIPSWLKEQQQKEWQQ